jgi:two-component system, NtrC family, sensor histidine kinase GlrK
MAVKAPFPSADGASARGGRRPYLNSFFSLLMLGFLLVALPLLVSIVRFTMQAEEMERHAEEALNRVTWLVEDTQGLHEAGLLMEHMARQALVLGEAPEKEAYAALHGRFVQTALRLSKAQLPADMAAFLRDAIGAEAKLNEHISGEKPATQEVARDILALSKLMDSLVAAGHDATEGEIKRLRAELDAAERESFIEAAIIVPLVPLLAAGVALMLTRPLNRIDRAITLMGAGHLESQINVNWPRDIRMLGQRLDWLRVRLKELQSDRELLSQSISHDLKTPLTSIYEGTDLLTQGLAGALNPRQQEVVNIMRDSVQAMSGKIEELMTVRSSWLRDAPVELRPVGLRALIESVVAEQRFNARARQVTVDVAGAELEISADAAKLRIVLDNLLSNAIRYSPADGLVFFELRKLGDRARIEISDEGPGIDAVRPEDVFEAGYRARNQPDSGVTGSGMGLNIAREFVIAHGGEIQVLPKGSALRRRGAKFLITLPGLIQDANGAVSPPALEAPVAQPASQAPARAPQPSDSWRD